MAVSGKIARTYVVTSSDKGKIITAKVTAIRSGYSSATTMSAPIGVS